jgi:hypothetical protein
VGLVDHHDVVVRDHRHALDRVDREQGVVGDDQVRALRLLAGQLGEALGTEGALGRAEALPVVDRDLAPLAVGVARRVVALTAAPAADLSSAQAAARGTLVAIEPWGPRLSAPWSSGTRRGCGAGRRSWSDPETA